MTHSSHAYDLKSTFEHGAIVQGIFYATLLMEGHGFNTLWYTEPYK